MTEEWSNAVRDFLAKAARLGRPVPMSELNPAFEREKASLRAWARFPRDGEVYEALRDIEVDFVTHWSAPFTGGGKGRLPAGTHVRVIVLSDDPEPIGVYAKAVNRPTLEQELVPAADRHAEKYAGFSLCIDTDSLNQDFRLVESGMGE